MEIARHWRLQRIRYRLEGSNCQNCEIKHFPPRDVCPDCGFGGTIFNSKDNLTKNEVSIPLTPVLNEQVQD